MKVIGIVVITIIIFLTVKIILREEKKKTKSIKLNMINRQNIETQLNNWTDNYKPTTSYSLADYICSHKMHNGETEQIFQMDQVDYMAVVQVVERKKEV